MRLRNTRLLASPLRSSAGFSLMEVMVAMGIIAIIMGFFGTGIFQALSIQRTWIDDVRATRELRTGINWFTSDALNAETVDLTDCGGAPCVTLAWTDQGLTCRHTAVYKMSSTTLVRVLDNTTTTPVADGVVSGGTSFSLSIRLLTFDLEVDASPGKTAATSVNTYLRKEKTPPGVDC